MLRIKKIQSAGQRMYSASWQVCDSSGNPLGLHLARFEYRRADLAPETYSRGWMILAASHRTANPLVRQAAHDIRDQRFHTRREALQAAELALDLATVWQAKV